MPAAEAVVDAALAPALGEPGRRELASLKPACRARVSTRSQALGA